MMGKENSYSRIRGTVKVSLYFLLWQNKSASVLLVDFLEGTKAGGGHANIWSVSGQSCFSLPYLRHRKASGSKKGVLHLAPWWVTYENGSLSPSIPLPELYFSSDLGLGLSFQIRDKLKMLWSDSMQEKIEGPKAQRTKRSQWRKDMLSAQYLRLKLWNWQRFSQERL